ncbi:MAG: hypothetical protein R3B36_20060 [Polyangiaceae bacterium]
MPLRPLRLARALLATLTLSAAGAGGFVACSDDPPAAPDDAGADATPAPTPTPVPPDSGRTPRGERIVGVDLQAGTRDFIAELREVKEATGMQATNLTFQWDDVELSRDAGAADAADAGDDAADDGGDAGDDGGATDAGVDPPTDLFNAYFHIANLVYPQERVSVNLALNPVDTNGPHLPVDLAGKKLDDPEVAARFARVEDYAFSQLPKVDLAMVVLGNEIDLGLGDDPAKYAEFTKLFVAAATHARTRRPGVKVGFVVSHRAAKPPKSTFLTAAWAAADFVGLTYYPVREGFTVEPVEGIGKAFDDIVAGLPADKPIYVREVGYPTAAACGSSVLKQAAFVEEILRAWDRHRARVPLLTFFQSSDYPAARVDELASYYNLQDPTFKAMLGSFGLRAEDGSPKAAFPVLSSELKARGW